MTLALCFGFLNNYIEGYNFERLHIFLFNLCSGGSIIILYTSRFKINNLIVIFLLIACFLYTLFAFEHSYLYSSVFAMIIFFITEYIRHKYFGSIYNFLRRIKLSTKFNHASLLCLSIGLIISIFAMINEHSNIFHLEKLNLNTFFLGFSFPISLITFSVIFKLIESNLGNKDLIAEIIFWVINLGVIIFFIFILIGSTLLELIISSILSIAVLSVFIIFFKLCKNIQQKYFILSGMFFLICTAVTGILYILCNIYFSHNKQLLDNILAYHRFISLYGWNLSGLAVIVRFNDFPIKLNSVGVISLHWLTVAILAPISLNSTILPPLTVTCYAIFLFLIFFSKPNKKIKINKGLKMC